MTGMLMTQVANKNSLKRAWADVLENDLDDGKLSGSVLNLAVDIKDELATLSAELLNGTYRPRDLTEFSIPKRSGGMRTLHIPDPRDRVVERAILNVVGPILDPLLGPAAYGFRPGLGVKHAVREVARCRDEGLNWVLRADVKDCFPSLDVVRIEGLLTKLIPDGEILAIISLLNDRYANKKGKRHAIPGLSQGSPLSPLFSNLALVEFDETLLRAGFPLVRYGDDFTVCTQTKAGAERARTIAERALEEIGMALNTEKSDVMSFTDGFHFLGEEFGPKYPLAEADDGADPGKKTLFVARDGAHVRMKSGRVRVDSKDDTTLLDVPQSVLERIVCFGYVGVSAGVRNWALQQDVNVVFLSRKGSYQGQLLSGAAKQRADRIRAQILMDTERRVELGREIVKAKISKQRVLLQRYVREENRQELVPKIDFIKEMSTRLPECQTRDELMGIEGASAKMYFEALPHILPEGITFAGRNRRPPTDVMNSALSYLYTVMLGECVGALVACGLDPAIGCLHAESKGTPSLGLDLVEEFRPFVVDQVVIELARRKILTDDDAVRVPGKPGVKLSKKARTDILEAYERRMQQKCNGALPGFGGSVRRHLHQQAKRLGKAIRSENVMYTGLSWR